MMAVLVGAYFSRFKANNGFIVPTSVLCLARSSVFNDRVGKPERALRTAKGPEQRRIDFSSDAEMCRDGAQAAILSHGSSGYCEPI
jgi:hypothetical protein